MKFAPEPVPAAPIVAALPPKRSTAACALWWVASAVGPSLAVLGTRVAADPALGANGPFLMAPLAAMAAARLAGLRAGAAATALTVLGSEYLFAPPRGGFDFSHPAHLAHAGVAVAVSLLSAAFVSRVTGFELRQRQMHGELVTASDSFRAVAAVVLDYAVFLLDAKGRVATWNEGAHRIKGYEEDEILGKPYEVFFRPEDRRAGEPLAMLRRAEADGNVRAEKWRVRKDGSEFLAQVSLTALRDDLGNLRGFVKVTRDVTEERRILKEMRDTARELARVVDGAAEYAIFALDANGHIATWNAGARRIKGFEARDVLGRHLSILYPPGGQSGDGTAQEHLDECRRTGNYVGVGRRVRKDGSLFWAHVTINRIDDEAGNFVGFVKVVQDVTERKLAEERHELALEAGRIGTWRVEAGRDARYLSGRAQDLMFGRRVAAEDAPLPLSAVLAAVHPDDRHVVTEALQAALAGGPEYAADYRVVHPGGQTRWVVSRGRSVRGGDGRVERIEGVVVDVTREAQVVEALRAERARLAEMVNTSLDAVVVMGRDGNVAEWNPAAEAIFGYAAAEAVGRQVADLIVPPGRRTEHLAGLRRYLETGQSSVLGGRYQLQGLRKDGSLIEVDIALSTFITPEGGEQFLAMVRDVTEQKRVQDALAQREADYARTMEAARVGTWKWWPDTDRLQVSHVALDVAGQETPIPVSLRETIETVIHPAHRAGFREALETAVRDGAEMRHEHINLGSDGRERWVLATGRYLSDEGVFYGTSQDISPQKRAEFALRESEERHRATFDYAAVGIAHVARDGSWLRVNRRFSEILGRTLEELKGTTFEDVTHPDDVDGDVAQARRILAGEIDTYSLEKRYLRPDGSPVWVNLTVSAVRDEHGTPVYFIALVEDIDARKRAEHALRESEAELRRILDNVHDYAIFAVDADGNIATWNLGAERIKQYTRDEVVGQSPGLLYPEGGASEDGSWEAHLDECRRTGRYEGSGHRRRKDGSLFWAHVVINRVDDAGGNFAGYAKVVQDVSAAKLAEDRHQLALEAGQVGTWHYDFPADRRGMQAQAQKILFGRQIAEPDEDIPVDVFVGAIVDEDRDRVAAAVARAVEGLEEYACDYRVRHWDGQIRHVSARARSQRDVAGRVYRMEGILRDTTEQVRAAAAVQESEARLSGIIASARDAILVVDENQHITGINPAAERMFGYAADESLGRPLSLLLPERFHGAHAGHVRGFGGSGVTARSMGALGALTARRRDGTEFPIEAAISQTRTAEGGLLFTAIVRDITERKQMEEERARAAARQEQIAEALQRSLLLVPPPDAFPGITVKAVYESASDDALIGGDFFDAFAVEEDTVALVVGDVTGKGLSAATFTAEVRFALRAFLREDADPAAALSRLNRFVARAARFDKAHLGATYVAAAVAVVDTLTGALWCSSAGMEPPLLVNTGGVAELTAGGPLLGVLPEAEYEGQEAALAPGTILAMTTDGITEARSAAAFFGLDGLAAVVGELAGRGEPLGEIAPAVVARAREFAGGLRQDDVCLLLARRRP